MSKQGGVHMYPIIMYALKRPGILIACFFITKFEYHFLIGWLGTFQTSFLEVWRIHKTLLKSSFRNRSDINHSTKCIHLGISPPVYCTHLDSCSNTAIQCKQLTDWHFCLRTYNGKDPILSILLPSYIKDPDTSMKIKLLLWVQKSRLKKYVSLEDTNDYVGNK